jgi:hypothetical protein
MSTHLLAIFVSDTAIRYSHSFNRYSHTAMDQSKIKKIMKLTQRWIQDNKYSSHATTMTHNQWMKVRPDPGTDIWKFEAEFVMTNDHGLEDLGKWKLVDIIRCYDQNFPEWGCNVSTYRLTETGTRSTQDLIDLEDHGM